MCHLSDEQAYVDVKSFRFKSLCLLPMKRSIIISLHDSSAFGSVFAFVQVELA